MDKDVSIYDDNAPLLPPHTKQAAKAMALLLFYSILMFTLPFGSFYVTKYILQDTFHIDGFTNVAISVFVAVVTVNVIIFAYVYHAYHETEYDDEGNEISPNTSTKSDLNVKCD